MGNLGAPTPSGFVCFPYVAIEQRWRAIYTIGSHHSVPVCTTIQLLSCLLSLLMLTFLRLRLPWQGFLFTHSFPHSFPHSLSLSPIHPPPPHPSYSWKPYRKHWKWAISLCLESPSWSALQSHCCISSEVIAFQTLCAWVQVMHYQIMNRESAWGNLAPWYSIIHAISCH